jgi:2-polyprenyl-6-methoxyphenol hydroxylase-like FAD-dependent oxidoreductase
MTFPQTTTHVLVVGAGPIGLTLANELLRHGVPCRLIDSSPHATIKVKALGIMPRTLELLAKMGLTDEAIKRGFQISAFSPFSNGKRITKIAFKEHLSEIPYPFPLMLPQHETEALLTEQLVHQGGAIEWGTELVQLTQHEGHVEATLRHLDGQEEHVQAEWLVGCDGAHSAVRHVLHLDFEGTTLGQSFAVGNVTMHWELPADEMYVFVRQGSFIAFFPMKDGRHRVIIAYDLEKAPEGEVTLEEIQGMIDVSGLPVGTRADSPTELGRFQVNQRKAIHYTQGRVFLAGDAAHVHSPVGAQGLNTGMQDAFNLAWKLALVVKGQAAPKLLDSYEVEREQVGTALLKGTNLATRVALTRNPLLTTLRTQVAPLVLSNHAMMRRMAQIVTEISLAYHQSDWIVDQRGKKGALEAGDRAPNGRIRIEGREEPGSLFDIFATTRSVLLVFAGNQPAAAVVQHWQEIEGLLAASSEHALEAYLVTEQNPPEGISADRFLQDVTGELHQRYDCLHGGLLLVRPDGYIGFWGPFGATEALRTYLKRLFI